MSSTHLQRPAKPHPGARLSILSQPVEEGCVAVTMAGDLDLATADRAATVLDGALDEGDRVVCHVGRLRFIDLHGLQTLLEAAARARREGALLTVTDSPEVLTRIVTLLGLRDALDLHPDGDAARS